MTNPGQKLLPKYDFPKSMLNCTPGTILYMEKEVGVDEDGSEKIQTSSHDLLTVIKSKAFHGSSADTWASHLIENSYRETVVHEEQSYKVFRLPM